MHQIPSQMAIIHHPAPSDAAGQINGGCFHLGDGKAVNCNTSWNLIMQNKEATLELLIRGLIQKKFIVETQGAVLLVPSTVLHQ